jgi:hypothetical protein
MGSREKEQIEELTAERDRLSEENAKLTDRLRNAMPTSLPNDPLQGRPFACKRCKGSFRLEKYSRNYYEPDICITKCPWCEWEIVFFEWGGSAELPNLLEGY